MSHKVRTPLFPSYTHAAALMRAAIGSRPQAVRDMISAIHAQTGTPQNPVDWSEPDQWIDERLSGGDAELAAKIWNTDDGVLNPRHSYGSWMYINNYQLMEANTDGLWQPSEPGRLFLDNDPATLRYLDDEEGLLKLLEMLAARELAKRGDLLPEWTTWLREVSRFSSVNSCSGALHQRLVNLVSRHLVERDGNRYQITGAGREWLDAALPPREEDPRRDLLNTVKRYNEAQKELLMERLATMDPYRFEQLIGELLEAMGYEDVEVTKASGDKGVDVVAQVQLGITAVTEVVQVKRMQGSIGRPMIDQLRGALPYHKAIRGTLITTGKFASSCAEAALFPGAAPITLIDGERLRELLVEHGVGIRRSNEIELLDVDNSVFQVEEGLALAD